MSSSTERSDDISSLCLLSSFMNPALKKKIQCNGQTITFSFLRTQTIVETIPKLINYILIEKCTDFVLILLNQVVLCNMFIILFYISCTGHTHWYPFTGLLYFCSVTCTLFTTFVNFVRSTILYVVWSRVVQWLEQMACDPKI